MTGLHIILDSTANPSADFLATHANVHVVSLSVTVGERNWPEEALPSQDLFARVRSGAPHPKTSQPSPGSFLATLEPLVAAGNEVIVITIAAALSGTYQTACAAARQIGGDKVWVVDSGTTAIGMIKLAEAALAAADVGVTVREIVDRLHKIAQHTSTMFVPGTLEYLQKGGRIGGAAALIGTILQIRPVLYLVTGKVEVLDKVRTRQRAVNRMIEELSRRRPSYIGVVHIEAPLEAEALKQQLADLYPEAEISLTTGGSVLGTHLGPGLIGLIIQEVFADGK